MLYGGGHGGFNADTIGAIAEWSACWTFDPAVGVPVPLAAGGHVAIVVGLGLLSPPSLNGR